MQLLIISVSGPARCSETSLINFAEMRSAPVEQSERPRAPLTYFNDGGGGPSDFFGSIKDAGIFWGREKNGGIFLGMLKKVVIFLGKQILKVWFFWV